MSLLYGPCVFDTITCTLLPKRKAWFLKLCTCGCDLAQAQESHVDARIVFCRRCGLGWTLEPYAYSETLGSYTDRGLTPYFQQLVLRMEFNKLFNAPAKEKRVLEVGPGSGLLARMLKRHGYNVFTLDNLDTSHLLRHGIHAIRGIFEEMKPEQLSEIDPHVLVFRHAFEHLHDPETAIRLMALLKPGSQIIIIVPNCASQSARVMGKQWPGWSLPEHRTHWSPASAAVNFCSLGTVNVVPLLSFQYRRAILNDLVVWPRRPVVTTSIKIVVTRKLHPA